MAMRGPGDSVIGRADEQRKATPLVSAGSSRADTGLEAIASDIVVEIG
jgi:hypothetical protein